MCCCDAPEFYEATTTKARKPHKCVECLRTIRSGESYERWRGRNDDGWYHGCTCAECVELRNDYLAAADCDCYCHGELMEYLDVRWAGDEKTAFHWQAWHEARDRRYEALRLARPQ